MSAQGQGRSRVHDTAMRLFAEHGVSGTSLQMIADELGVSKAAVYYHYRSKDDLVLGVVGPFVDRLETLVEEASGSEDPDEILVALIDVVVDARAVYVVLAADPSMGNLHERHPRLREVGERLVRLLVGPAADPVRRVAVLFVLSGLVGPLQDEASMGLSDERMREVLLTLSRRGLGG